MVRHALLPLLVVPALLLAGCTGRNTPNQESAANTPVQQSMKYDPATVGSITGTVTFGGAVPKPVTIDMSADPACKGQNASEALAVHDGKLANVLVHVKNVSGFSDLVQHPEVVVTQRGCRYAPHVVAVMAGQTVKFVNADDTMHNIHPMPRANREWNAAQASHAEPLEKKFIAPELMVPVKCNQHPWMKMYVNVMNNSFFAVTGADGKFDLKGLPPGTYTVEAVHESLGAQQQEITLGNKENRNVEFTFASQKGAAAAK